jgi:hypothetical protein
LNKQVLFNLRLNDLRKKYLFGAKLAPELSLFDHCLLRLPDESGQPTL